MSFYETSTRVDPTREFATSANQSTSPVSTGRSPRGTGHLAPTVAISFASDFEAVTTTPTIHLVTSLEAELDAVIAWTNALAPLRAKGWSSPGGFRSSVRWSWAPAPHTSAGAAPSASAALNCDW